MNELDQNNTQEKRLSRTERQALKMEERIKKLSQLRGNEDIEEIIGYVYRENLTGKRTALPPVKAFLEDHQVGVIYGPGEYSIVYKYLDPVARIDGEECTTITYLIGPEYAEIHREHCAQSGQRCYLDARAVIPGIQPQETGLSSLFNEDKIKGLIGLLGAVKMILGKDDSSGDLRAMLDANTKLLASAIGNKSNGFTEQLMNTTFTRLLDGPAQASPTKLVKDQLELFQTFENMRNPQLAQQREEQENEKMKSPIEKTIDKVLEHLPSFLERFGGDEQKASQQLKKEHPEAHLLKFKPEYASALYVATAKKYGIVSADRWAYGLGIDPNKYRHLVSQPVQEIQPPAQPQAPKQGIQFR
jgi:hypothetical protein